jgi:hypothetical protein
MVVANAAVNGLDIGFRVSIKDCIHYTSFSSLFTNWSNKLEFYIPLGWKDLQGQTLQLIRPFHKLKIK